MPPVADALSIRSLNEIQRWLIFLYPFLKKLNEEHGLTIVTVEHNLRAAMRNSKFLYHVANGSGHLCSPEEYIREYVKENTGSESYV